MKIKVQAQHLQLGDIVGSGEKVERTIVNTISLPSNKCYVYLIGKHAELRIATWGKYSLINVERVEKDHDYEASNYGICKRCGKEKH